MEITPRQLEKNYLVTKQLTIARTIFWLVTQLIPIDGMIELKEIGKVTSMAGRWERKLEEYTRPE